MQPHFTFFNVLVVVTNCKKTYCFIHNKSVTDYDKMVQLSQNDFKLLHAQQRRKEIVGSIKTSPIRPWWPSGLERVSNSSRYSHKGPRFESRSRRDDFHILYCVTINSWNYYEWTHYVSSTLPKEYTLQHRDFNDQQHKVQRYRVTVSWLIQVNGWV